MSAEFIGAIIGGALSAGMGILIGRFLLHPRSRPRRKCSCRHTYALHDAKGRCMKKREYRLDCPCVRYDGPTPLPEYYAPEIGE